MSNIFSHSTSFSDLQHFLLLLNEKIWYKEIKCKNSILKENFAVKKFYNFADKKSYFPLSSPPSLSD